jgi:hypothetical protein
MGIGDKRAVDKNSHLARLIPFSRRSRARLRCSFGVHKRTKRAAQFPEPRAHHSARNPWTLHDTRDPSSCSSVSCCISWTSLQLQRFLVSGILRHIRHRRPGRHHVYGTNEQLQPPAATANYPMQQCELLQQQQQQQLEQCGPPIRRPF